MYNFEPLDTLHDAPGRNPALELSWGVLLEIFRSIEPMTIPLHILFSAKLGEFKFMTHQ